jgi:hypothetical protein
MARSTQFLDWKAPANLAPADLKSENARAMAFVTLLSMECSSMLTYYINYCKGIQKTSETNGALSPEKLGLQREAVKELVCQSIYVTLADQAEPDVPDWLKHFGLTCWALADELIPQPSSQSILDKYANIGLVDDNYQATSFNLCMKLGLGETRPNALLFLGEMMQYRQGERNRLLHLSLTEPEAKLDGIIANYGNEPKEDLIPEFSIDDMT